MHPVVNLPDNHAFYNLENAVSHCFDNNIKQFGITYFNYARVYDDGHCFILSNHHSMVQYMFETGLPVIAPVDTKYVSNKFNG